MVQLLETERSSPILMQGKETDGVYLVLSGSLAVTIHDLPVLDSGKPVFITAGGIAGEVSAIQGGPATSTVAGDAVVLKISKDDFLRQVNVNQDFRKGLERLVELRLRRGASLKTKPPDH
jgi:CRP-like cAMP-binding protein